MGGRQHSRRNVPASILVVVALLAVLLPGCDGPAAPTNPGAASTPGAAPVTPTTAAQPAPLQPVRVAYSSNWGPNVIPWTTYEAGLFAKYGIDAQLTFISSAMTVPAAVAGEVDVSFGGGYAAVASRLGGSDLLIFFNVTNWQPYEFMVTPDINSPADLVGKHIGVSRLGSVSDVTTRVALRQLGLVPERDVVILQIGGLTERIAAMRAGTLAGGVALPPDNLLLRREGFHSLLDLATSGEQELTNTAFATARWLNANPDTAQAFTNALVEGIAYAKANRAFTEGVLGQYLELTDAEAIAVTYDYFVAQHLQPLPDIGEEAASSYLSSLIPTDERAASARPADFFDMRFINQVRASGLVERLYQQQGGAR